MVKKKKTKPTIEYISKKKKTKPTIEYISKHNDNSLFSLVDMLKEFRKIVYMFQKMHVEPILDVLKEFQKIAYMFQKIRLSLFKMYVESIPDFLYCLDSGINDISKSLSELINEINVKRRSTLPGDFHAIQ